MALSDNLDLLKEKAASAAQLAAKKTKQVAAVAKANVSILAEEDKIKRAQQELGKLYYRDFAMEEEPDEAEYLPWCEKITESRKTIEALRAQIEETRNGDSACEDDAEDEYVSIEAEFEPEEPAAPEAEDAQDNTEF